MAFSLFRNQETLISEKTQKGEYQSANEISAAEPDSTNEHEEALARIRAQIEEGFAQAERGELLDGSAVFQSIRRRGS